MIKFVHVFDDCFGNAKAEVLTLDASDVSEDWTEVNEQDLEFQLLINDTVHIDSSSLKRISSRNNVNN